MSNKNLEQLCAVSIQPDWQRLVTLPDLAKAGNTDAQREICGALIWAGFACPAAVTAVYDGLFLGKLNEVPFAESEDTELPKSFWQAFAQTLDGPEQGYDATSITATVAALGGATNPQFYVLAEQAALDHPGAADAASREVPPRIDLSRLADYDDGSLAKSLYRMLVDNGYDAEVLDRESIGLSALPPTLRYLNTRILQMHDVWHLLAGYETTGMHEIAISAFQLAQFGHNYSAMFLATVSTMSQRNGPQAFNLMQQIFADGWRHGRATPALMEIEFESVWHKPIDELRDNHGVTAFSGTFPPDLFEQLRAAEQNAVSA